MGKLVGWTCITVLAVCGLWDLGRINSTVPPWIMGVLLLGIGLLAGLRLGSDSVSAFVKDLLRLNKYLADQNNQLTELNHWHVKRQSPQKSAASEESEKDADDYSTKP